MEQLLTPLAIAVVVISDSRTETTDTSGAYLTNALVQAGHHLFEKTFIADDMYAIRATVSRFIVEPKAQVVLCTGGTGFAQRDVTPNAVQPLFDYPIDGFGELFRHISHATIGTSALQSRALAGIANKTLIFCLPGSSGACRDAWEHILVHQLDSRYKPCNFVTSIFP